jgi:hypothetical protein
MAGWTILALIVGSVALQTMAMSAERGRLEHQVQVTQAGIRQMEIHLAPIRARLQAADQGRAAIAQLRAGEAPVDVMNMLEAAAPDGLWLTSLTLERGSVRAGGSALRWPLVQAFVRALRDEGTVPVLDSVVREAGAVTTFRFTVSLTPPERGRP